MCIKPSIIANEQKCFIPNHIQAVWIISFGLAVCSIGLLTLTVVLFLASHYVRRSIIEYGRLSGFTASKMRIK